MITGVTVRQRVKEADIGKAELHTLVDVADVLQISFRQEKSMARFRRLVYSINGQGTYRYRTLRGDDGMWCLLVLRLR